MTSIDKKKSELCLACMECCKLIGFPFSFPRTAAALEWAKARGLKIYRDMVVLDHPCPHLDLVTGCDIYETRPLICREFDGRRSAALRGKCLWESLDKEGNDG